MDEAEEMLFYDDRNPQKAVLKDNLPGSPQINEDGSIVDVSMASAIPYLIVPGLTVLVFLAYLYFF